MAKIYYLGREHDFSALVELVEALVQSKLSSLSLDARVKKICELAKDLRKQLAVSDSYFSSLIHKHYNTLGFSPHMLRWGFAQSLAQISEKQIFALISAQAPAKIWAKNEFCSPLCLMPAATVPPATLQDLLLPLILPTAIILRPSRRQFSFFRELLEWLSQAHVELASCIALAEIAHEEEAELLELFSLSQCISLASSMQTLKNVQAVCERLKSETRPRIQAFAHRVSAAIIRQNEVACLCKADYDALAFDIRAWDLQGCLSPRYVAIEGEVEDCIKFAKTLESSIQNWEKTIPSLHLNTQEAAAQNIARRTLALDAAEYFETEYCALVIYDKERSMANALAANTLAIHPCKDALLALQTLSPYGQCLASVRKLECAEQERAKAFGFSHFCQFGEMQKPDLLWRRDGVGQLAYLFASP
ncbi:MAG: acyl-CoA reductase [Bradymonadales bacterium]|jgi:hypothetical protein